MPYFFTNLFFQYVKWDTWLFVETHQKPSLETFSNQYALDIGLGGSYGHNFKLVKLKWLVQFDGVVLWI